MTSASKDGSIFYNTEGEWPMIRSQRLLDYSTNKGQYS
jgi:hypothetical protein